MACLSEANEGRECIGAILDWVPCVDLAKKIFDVVSTAIKRRGKHACEKEIGAAASIPVSAVSCASFGKYVFKQNEVF